MDFNFYDLKIKLDPGVVLTLPWGYIHVHYHSSFQVYWYISQVSGECLQDHWSSGIFLVHILTLIGMYSYLDDRYPDGLIFIPWHQTAGLGLEVKI